MKYIYFVNMVIIYKATTLEFVLLRRGICSCICKLYNVVKPLTESGKRKYSRQPAIGVG